MELNEPAANSSRAISKDRSDARFRLRNRGRIVVVDQLREHLTLVYSL